MGSCTDASGGMLVVRTRALGPTAGVAILIASCASTPIDESKRLAEQAEARLEAAAEASAVPQDATTFFYALAQWPKHDPEGFRSFAAAHLDDSRRLVDDHSSAGPPHYLVVPELLVLSNSYGPQFRVLSPTRLDGRFDARERAYLEAFLGNWTPAQ